MTADPANDRLGWIGVGRMGAAIVPRLLVAGRDVAVYNRTRSKAEELAADGAEIVDSATDLADRDVVFTMVAGDESFRAVTIGSDGVLSRDDAAPQVIVDSSTVSAHVSEEVRGAAAERGAALLAAPVSGNPAAVRAGRLSVVASGPRSAMSRAQPHLELFGDEGVTYVGEGESARLVKICHNLILAALTQSLAEVLVLAEKAGVKRSDLLAFLNSSAVGSRFTRYKTPAFVELDFTTTFTPEGLRKDLDLGLDAGRDLGVELPVTQEVRNRLHALIEAGYTDVDFAALLELQAKAAGLELEPESLRAADGASAEPSAQSP